MALPVLPRGVELRPLGPALAAEVDGLDLRRPIPAPVAAWLREALQRHHFLCVRGQVLDEDGATKLANRPKDWPEQAFTPTAGHIAGSIGIIALGFVATLGVSRLGRGGKT